MIEAAYTVLLSVIPYDFKSHAEAVQFLHDRMINPGQRGSIRNNTTGKIVRWERTASGVVRPIPY